MTLTPPGLTGPPAVSSEDLHRIYRQLLMALALPGRPRTVPVAENEDEAVALIVASGWDHDTPIAYVDGMEANGAGTTAAEVVVAGDVEAAQAILAAPRGSEEQPERGATVVVVARAGPALNGESAMSTPARLTGPGVDGVLEVVLPLGVDALAARADACADWPLGVDVVVVAPGPRVVGLPRTTVVEVLA